MNKQLLAALVAAGILSACGGGGGGGGTRPGDSVPVSSNEPLAPLGQVAATDHHIDYTQQTALTPAGLGSFDSLNAMPAPEVSLANTPQIRVAIPDLNVDDVFDGPVTTTMVNGLRVDTSSKADGTTRRTVTYLAPDAASTYPYKLQFSSLGVWNTTDVASGQMTNAAAFSVGTRTLGSDIPTTGTATYNGAMLGVAVEGGSQYSVSANASALANFGARNVSMQTTNSMRTDLATGAAGAAPGYNMTGTLTYPAATNSLSGTLTTADGKTGAATGNFYGPRAAELGVTFNLGAPSGTLVGGAALKR
jgi:transferrin binding protein